MKSKGSNTREPGQTKVVDTHVDDSSSGDDFSFSEEGGMFGSKADDILATGG